MQPSIGRVVHLTINLKPVAAIVSGVHDGLVDLHVLPAGGPAYDLQGVSYSEEPKEGCWTWPPRV